MKNIVSIFLLIVVCCMPSKGQSDWDLIHEDKVYTYYYCSPIALDRLYPPNNYTDTLSNCYHNIFIKNIDTIGTDTFCFFNLEVDTIWNSTYQVYDWGEAPSAFFQQAMVKKANGEIHFQGEDTFVLKPHAILNDSWLYKLNDTIIATFVNIDTISLWGVSDSIKIVQLSNGDTISWSKYSGLLQFPVKAGTTSHLIGIQDDSMSLGIYIPDFWDIYNFEVGDVFMYQGYVFNSNAWLQLECTTKSKVTITGKQVLNDRCIYSYTVLQENSGCYECPLNFRLNNPKTFIDDAAHPVNQYSNSLTSFLNTISLGYDTELTFLEADSSGDLYKRVFEHDGLYTYTYELELGATDYNFMAIGSYGYCKLVGYVKGQDTTGIIWQDSLILSTEPIAGTIEIPINTYPNPATDFINIYVPKNPIPTIGSKLHIYLYNSEGKLLQNHTLPQSDATYMLTTEGLASGLYILQVLDGEGRVLGTEKVVVKK